ncbi:hypothetical protein Tco_1105958 [Tanacetum coccineum]
MLTSMNKIPPKSYPHQDLLLLINYFASFCQCYHHHHYLIPKISFFPRRFCHLRTNCFLSSSSTDTSAPPHVFKIGESSHVTRLERHEEWIDTILNHLDELPLERIEQMEDKIEGIVMDFHYGDDHRGYLGPPPIRYEESSGYGMSMSSRTTREDHQTTRLDPCIMDMINDQDIEHMTSPTSRRETEPPVGSPYNYPLSSSVRISNHSYGHLHHHRLSLPMSLSSRELDNSLWIIPRPLESEPILEKPNELDAC